MKKVVLLAMLCGAVAVSGSSLYAACAPADITPIGQFLTGVFNGDDTGGRIQGFAYQLSSPATVNSGKLNIGCSSAAGPSLTCTGSSPGAESDHQFTVETDGIVVGWNGCPAKFTPAGRLIVVVIDAAGAGSVLSVSGMDPGFGYFLEMAQNTTDGTDIIPLTTGDSSRPRVLNYTNSGTTVNAQLRVGVSVLHHDCGANSLGKLLTDAGQGTICDGFNPSVAQGRLYTSLQPCGIMPDMNMAAWTVSAVTPDAAGNATLSAPSPATPNCLWVSGSNTVNGSPEFLTGVISIAPPLAPSARAENVRVANANGKVTVSWTTSTEVGLGTFKILTDSKGKGQLEVATVAPKGNGGASAYAEKLGMGDFKGGRSVIVRSVMTDGTVLDSAAVNF